MGLAYGYVRVSSREQNASRQLAAMEKLAIPPGRIFIDKQSGKNFKRPQYEALLETLKEGDGLCVLSLDRLGRDYGEIQKQWRMLTRVKGIDINVLDMPLLDTRRNRDLLATFIADLVLQILSYVAQTEREHIRDRQAQGIAAAKMRGVRFGRDAIQLPENFEENCLLWRDGIITGVEASERCRMAQSTFYRKAKSFLHERGYDSRKAYFKRS